MGGKGDKRNISSGSGSIHDYGGVRGAVSSGSGDQYVTINEAARKEGPVFVAVPPLPTHEIVGREQMLGELRQRLIERGERNIALEGKPGVGKTTVAVLLAWDALSILPTD